MKKTNKVEYFFLAESFKRVLQDINRLSEFVSDMSPEECYEMMCRMEAIKENIDRFELKAKESLNNNDL